MTDRIKYYDSLRGIAIIAVVFIHSLSYKDHSTIGISVFFRQLINFAVPLFLGISGFFLAKKDIQTTNEYLLFLKKQITRVYVPYLFWSIGFFAMYVLLFHKLSAVDMIMNVLTFQSAPIFYFVALIIQYYLLFPFLKKYLPKIVVPSIIVSLMACVAIFLYKYYYDTTLPLIVYAGNFLTWVMFFVLGLFLGTRKININPRLLLILILIFLVASNFETYFQFEYIGSITEAVTAVKISSFIYSGLLLVYFLNFKRNWTLFSDLGVVSYTVFLMHLLVLPFVKHFSDKVLNQDSFFIDIAIGSITLLICYYFCVISRNLFPRFSNKVLGI